MTGFLVVMALVCWVAACVFGVLAMQGEAVHIVSTLVMTIAGFAFIGITRVGR